MRNVLKCKQTKNKYTMKKQFFTLCCICLTAGATLNSADAYARGFKSEAGTQNTGNASASIEAADSRIATGFKNNEKENDPVLMTIDGKEVTASEFMYIYRKNNSETALDQKSLDEYLELFTNFKLKVAEAESEGIDTTQAFIKELAGYRAQATPKYMRDEEAFDSIVSLSYHRMAHIRRAAHIAIECRQDASDSAKAAARALIEELRMKATGTYEVKGKVQPASDFNELARTYSTDPSAKETGGELGWILPFRYVYSLEEAIYNTPVGQITEVFQSSYGLHIALVEEEIETEEVHAAHIMKMTAGKDSEQEESAKKQIDSLYNVLAAGADFAQTAAAESDDKGSSVRGGDLGWFSRGMMVKDFENTAFSMNSGDISRPFRSQYGWHIIKLYGRRPLLPLDSIRSQVVRNVQRDERAQEADKAFIRKTRAEYNLPADMSDEDVRAYADAHLEEKYEDLRHLVQEYHDGILLFETSLKNVWDKAGKDTAGLARFFKEHKKNYTWSEKRFKGWIIQAQDEATARRALTIIKTANPDSVKSYIARRVNNDSTTLVRVEQGVWKKGQNAAVDKYGFKLKNTEFQPRAEWPVVKAYGKLKKAPEEYNDERGRVTSDYQDELEKEWIKELKKKHTVVVNKEVFESLKK